MLQQMNTWTIEEIKKGKIFVMNVFFVLISWRVEDIIFL